MNTSSDPDATGAPQDVEHATNAACEPLMNTDPEPVTTAWAEQ
jgi:hypothetical protein